jgi:hypothetical protein
VEARTNAYCAEITPVGDQYAVDLPPFGDSGHHPIDESQAEIPESGVKLERARNIEGER